MAKKRNKVKFGLSNVHWAKINLSRIFSGIVIDDIVYTIVGIEIFVAAVGINRQ